MTVEIISIGDELLIGQTVNTNAAWMGNALSKIGASVQYCTVVRDKREDLITSFETALNRVDLVLVTGGLGPTKDDITKKVLAEFFNTNLVLNEEVLALVQSFFKDRKAKMLEVNNHQAMIPANAKALLNKKGTAPGIWIEHEGKILVSMPGVPYEMKYIMTEHILPTLKERGYRESLYTRTIQTQGIGESYIADRMQDLEDNIRNDGLDLAYLPSPGSVRLRLSCTVDDDKIQRLRSYAEAIKERFPQYVFGEDNDQLNEVVGNLLLSRGKKMSTVESCTGGAVAASLVEVPGSSRYFEGSIISYSNKIKEHLVGVSADTLRVYGAVSKEVVTEMATFGRSKLNTDYCVALSGIAGPDGGTEEKPVGTVWIAIASDNGCLAKKFQFEKDRERNIRRSTLTALNLVRCVIEGINIEKS